MSGLIVGFFSSRIAGVVTLSGETIEHIVDDPFNAEVGIRFNADGTVDKNVGGSFSQIDSLTDWIIPNAGANAGYDLAYTDKTGSAWNNEASPEDTTVNMGTDRVYRLLRTTVGLNTITCNFKLFIDAGLVGVASYTFNAEVEGIE